LSVDANNPIAFALYPHSLFNDIAHSLTLATSHIFGPTQKKPKMGFFEQIYLFSTYVLCADKFDHLFLSFFLKYFQAHKFKTAT